MSSGASRAPTSEARPLHGASPAANASGVSSGKLYGTASSSSSVKPGSGVRKTVGNDEFSMNRHMFLLDPKRWLRETAHWLEASEETDPAIHLAKCCDEFRARKLKAPLVLAWIILQAANLVFSFSLVAEISKHLAEFETAIAKQCSPQHMKMGVCLGASWNLSYSDVLTFPPSDISDGSSGFDFVVPADRSFGFTTQSHPPTFLLGVEPRPESSVRWKVNVVPQAVDFGFPGVGRFSGFGDTHYFDDVSGRGSGYRVLVAQGSFQGRTEWKGSMSLLGKTVGQTKMFIYVVDSRLEHLDEIHKQEQCSFGESWQKFSERHNGEHHRVLTFTYQALVVFVCISGTLLGLVLYRFYYYIESGKLLRRVITMKFVIQDFPQQVCMVCYLFGWYARNGLRCQMCLFNPLHCETEHPLHWSNMFACIFTLLSASSNQLMLQAKQRQNSDGEDECCHFFARAVLFSVSALPFSTAIYLFPFWFPKGSHLVLTLILAGVPMLIGWGTTLCVPLVALCGDDDC